MMIKVRKPIVKSGITLVVLMVLITCTVLTYDYSNYYPFSKLKEHIKAGTCPALYENEKGEVQSFLETEPPILTKQPLDGYRKDKQKEMEFMLKTGDYRYQIQYRYLTSTISTYDDVLYVRIMSDNNKTIQESEIYENNIFIKYHDIFTKSQVIPETKKELYQSYTNDLIKKLKDCS